MKIRKIKKKHIAAAMVLSAAFLLPGCGTDAAEEAQTESNAAQKETGRTDMYDSVLAEYSDLVQHDFYMDLMGTDAYESSFGEHIGLEIRLQEQEIYYAFYDIDGNRIMELLIAGGQGDVSDEAFSPWNYDLYSYDGTKVVSVFPEVEFGYRTNFSLYENGVIKVFYSSSAVDSGVDFYKIGSDGITPELVDAFAVTGSLEEEEPVFAFSRNGKEITEEEYKDGIESYEIPLTTELEWIQIQ